LNGFASRIHSGKALAAQRFLWGPLTDLVTFSVFFGAAWAYRRRPEIHKRLIVVATTTLLIAAVGRLPFWLGALVTPWNFSLFIIIWLSPIFAAMIYDYFQQGHHPSGLHHRRAEPHRSAFPQPCQGDADVAGCFRLAGGLLYAVMGARVLCFDLGIAAPTAAAASSRLRVRFELRQRPLRELHPAAQGRTRRSAFRPRADGDPVRSGAGHS
jgi:hypothetical protein